MAEQAWPMDSINAFIQPEQTAENIYGAGFVYSPKLYARDYSHFDDDVLMLEALTGRELPVVGEMPVICHEGVVTPPALRLYEKAGLHIPSKRYTYRTDTEYVALLKRFTLQEMNVIFQYPHPTKDVPASLYHVKPDVMTYVNDKRNIPALVPKEHVPYRKMVSLEELKADLPPLPFILKTGDGSITAGGCGVLFIEEEAQLNDIKKEFGDVSSIIFEEYIDCDDSSGYHYVVDQRGDIQFLGKSKQVLNQNNCFRGSWLDKEAKGFERVVEAGRRVMENIAAAGYTGIAGFDVLTRGDEFYFVDLNVRVNGSTSSLLLHDSVTAQWGHSVARLSCLEWSGDFEEGMRALESFVDRKRFLPLCLLDASLVEGDHSGASKITGIVLGDSEEDVEQVLAFMKQKGIRDRA